MRKIFMNFGKTALVFAAVVAMAAGCRKDEIPVFPGSGDVPSDYEQVNTPADVNANPVGMYVLNEGNNGSNKAQLDFFNFRNAFYIRDVFTGYNPEVVKGLGDTGNDVQVYKGRVFTVVNGSHKVEIMNANTVKRIAKVDIPNCRYIAFSGNCAYVTSYVATDKKNLPDQKGALYRIDLDTYTVTGEVEVGYQPEQLVILDGKAYVANSGGYRSLNGHDYDNTVSVVDLKSMKVEYSIEVAINLSRMAADKNGAIWVSSLGNYTDVKSKLYCLEKKDGKYAVATSIDKPVANMTVSGDYIYVMGTEYDPVNWAPTTSYYKVNVNTRSIESDKFITDGTESGITYPYGLSVNPENGDIYLTDAKDFVSSGTLHCYSKEGKLKWSVRTGDVPAHIAFLYN